MFNVVYIKNRKIWHCLQNSGNLVLFLFLATMIFFITVIILFSSQFLEENNVNLVLEIRLNLIHAFGPCQFQSFACVRKQNVVLIEVSNNLNFPYNDCCVRKSNVYYNIFKTLNLHALTLLEFVIKIFFYRQLVYCTIDKMDFIMFKIIYSYVIRNINVNQLLCYCIIIVL